MSTYTLTGAVKDFGAGIPAGVTGSIQAGGMVDGRWTLLSAYSADSAVHIADVPVKIDDTGHLVRRDTGGAVVLTETSGFSYKLVLIVGKSRKVWYFSLTTDLDLAALSAAGPVDLTAATLPVLTVNGAHPDAGGDVTVAAAIGVSQAALDVEVAARQTGDAALTSALNGKANTSHTHGVGDVSGLGSSATKDVGVSAGTVAAGDDARFSDARTPVAHSHGLADLTATGTRNATTYLRGDNTWAVPGPLTGTGSPEGVVAASVGTEYVDTAATNGAVKWIKATGTGTTGWRVTFGDTGWRNVTSVFGLPGGMVYLRRFASDVHFQFAQPFSGGTLLEVGDYGPFLPPVGFRVSPMPTRGVGRDFFPYRKAPIAQLSDGQGHVTLWCDTYAEWHERIVIKITSADALSGAGFTYPATPDWPATLPGTPAALT